jgi:membrane-associated protein
MEVIENASLPRSFHGKPAPTSAKMRGHLETLRDWFHFLTDVRGLVQAGGYIALAIIVFTETGLMIGFFLPGDSLLVTAGLFAAKGDLNIVWLNLLLITCAILGDATGYLIGKKLGPALFRREDSLLFKKKHLIATHEFYEKHGGKTIILARFVPVIRTFAPVVAGIANMPYRRFAIFNIIGGIGWVFSMTMLGYLLVTIFPATEKHIEKVIIIVIFVSILPAIIEWLRARKKASQGTAE